jgi:chemotaxis signal transduction protein
VAAELLSPTVALTRYFVTPDQEHGLSGMAGGTAQVQRYGFRIGVCRFVHDVSLAVELTELPHCYDLPNSSVWFCGLVNLRGNLVPALDLKSLLGGGGSAGDRQMLLVIGSGERTAALVIDGTPDHISIDEGSRVEQPQYVPEILQDHLLGAHEFAGEIWYQVDYEGLFEALAQRTAE